MATCLWLSSPEHQIVQATWSPLAAASVATNSCQVRWPTHAVIGQLTITRTAALLWLVVQDIPHPLSFALHLKWIQLVRHPCWQLWWLQNIYLYLWPVRCPEDNIFPWFGNFGHYWQRLVVRQTPIECSVFFTTHIVRALSGAVGRLWRGLCWINLRTFLWDVEADAVSAVNRMTWLLSVHQPIKRISIWYACPSLTWIQRVQRSGLCTHFLDISHYLHTTRWQPVTNLAILQEPIVRHHFNRSILELNHEEHLRCELYSSDNTT